MNGRTSRARLLALLVAAAAAACTEGPTTQPDLAPDLGPQFGVASLSPTAAAVSAMMDDINAALAADGAAYRVGMAEYITAADGGDEAGQTVLAKNVGNKRLGFAFIPGDPRRAWGTPTGVTYAIDQTEDAEPIFGGLSAADTDAAIVRAMDTWEGLQCSDLGLARNADFGLDIGLVAFLNGLGGSPFVFADVQHAGWRDINFAGGILGVTFTFGFTSAPGVFTDVDRDGYLDAAFREIYYDPSFAWADDGTSNVDVETVALHEVGHGLSQGHFGQVVFKNDGSLMASPRAVMNALYAGPLRDLTGTDEGGHCAGWGNWPTPHGGLR